MTGFNVSFEAHKVVDSVAGLIQVVFHESPWTGNIATIIVVTTPLYFAHIWGTVRRSEKSNDTRLKRSRDSAKAKKASKAGKGKGAS